MLYSEREPARRIAEARAMLQESLPTSMQLMAIQTLAQEGVGAEAIGPALKADDPLVRLNAAGALVRLHREPARALLRGHYGALRDDQDRSQVVSALAAFGDGDDLDFIDEIIAGSSGELQALARRSRALAEGR